MNWKMILLGIAVLTVAGYGILYVTGYKFNRSKLLQGFQGAPAKNTFTMYYADWCGHCQQAKPAFLEFASKGTVKVGDKECEIRLISPEKEPEAAKGKVIKGFPTFMLETVDGKTVEYSGERTVDGYMAFINENLGGM